MIQEAAHYARMARGLRAAVRYPAHADPEEVLRDQLANRTERFLGLLERIVFANSSHPLCQMFAEARCTLGDVLNLARSQGLEATLELLRQGGVYLSHDELKGNARIVRNGREIPATQADFANPLAAGVWQTTSSGSRGKATTVSVGLASMAYRECYQRIALRQLGVHGRRWITLGPILPSFFNLTRIIWSHKHGVRADRWFAIGSRRDSSHYRLVTRFMLAELRLLGISAPPLSFLPPNDFSPVAREIAQLHAKGHLAFINGGSSSCVRVASAALEQGLDISGARFWTGGEALTPAKAEVFRRAGADAYATYWTMELGAVGFSCPALAGQNTVHFFRDALAVIGHRRQAPAADAEVNSLLFTTLLPSSPFFAVNLEMGDHGILRQATCGCEYAQLGFDTLIADIFSYNKLTGHGTTLVGTDIVRVLEEVLPARFGGSPVDYQLVEQEIGSDTRIVLRVNPRIGNVPAGQIRDCFLAELCKAYGGSLAARLWTHAASVEVLAEPPIVGRTGKVLPLHVLGTGAALKTAAAGGARAS
jgi:hypothetical protein